MAARQQLRHFTLCHFCATAAAASEQLPVHTMLQFFFCTFTIFRYEQISAILLLCCVYGYNLPFEEKKRALHFFHLGTFYNVVYSLPRKRERKFAQNDDCHSKVVFLNLFQIFFSFFYFYIYSIDLCTSSLYYENNSVL